MPENMSNTIMDCTSLDELINVEYGPKGTENRDMFDAETQVFCVAQTLREEFDCLGKKVAINLVS